MKNFFRTIGAAALVAALLGSAQAQVNVVPQVGVTSAYLPKTTYSAAFIGLVPVTGATDLVCIAGSATKTIRLQSVKLSGTNSAVVILPATLLRRVAVDSGGTAASTTANPANTISKRDVNSPTATATLISYVANPTINDTSPTYIDSASMTLPITTSVVPAVPLVFDFAKDVENLLQPPTLVGAAAQICVNLNATAIAAGLINGSITWTEE